MAVIQTSPPAAEPVCLEDAKAHLKVDHIEEDRLIVNLIGSARLAVENITGLSLVSQSWTVFLDDWPGSRSIDLPVAPIQSVAAINVYAEDDTPALVDPADYAADLISRPARIVLKASGSWISPGRAVNGIGIDLVAGYGANEDAVPEALRQAVLQLVTHWYDNRSSIQFGARPNAMPLGVTALLGPYRRVRL